MSESQATGSEAGTPAGTGEAQTFSADYVKQLRDEAAAARVGKKDAVDAAKTETRAEVIKEYEPQLAERDSQISELTTSLATASAEVLKLKAVIAEGIPVEDILTVVELVQGADEAGITESAKRVKSIYGKTPGKTPPFDPTQGHGNQHIPLNGNKVLDVLRRAVGAE